MTIRLLPPSVSASIAAGEVVERPASVVKELVENALDGGASRIEVHVPGDPASLIRVCDDGGGIPEGELALALERHATSKLPGDVVDAIATLGFRGEALPSIASVASIALSSRHQDGEFGWEVRAENGVTASPRPCSLRRGTRVEVRDLFRAHPARLKFLKSKRTETARIREAVDQAALSSPNVEFRLETPGASLTYPARGADGPAYAARAVDVLGQAFAADHLVVDLSIDGVLVRGAACVPTRSRRDASGIHACVNGRPVSSRSLMAAVRAAYSGLMAAGEQPCAFVAVSLDPSDVDVNVHPRKSEVRFRDEAAVCSAVTAAVAAALASSGVRTSADLGRRAAALAAPIAADHVGDRRRLPLGRYMGQSQNAWLIAETLDGFVIVDQHAAHERVVLERLKSATACPGGGRVLSAPARVDLTPSEAAALGDRQSELRSLGLDLDTDIAGACVRSVPTAAGFADPTGLVAGLARRLAENPGAALGLDPLAEALATAACHSAVRAGDALEPERADALLREIEATPNAAQCNHGRPTAVFLTSRDIERLFGRS